MTTDDRPLCIVRIDWRSPGVIIQSAPSADGERYGASAAGALWSAGVDPQHESGAPLPDGAACMLHIPAGYQRQRAVVRAVRSAGLHVVYEGGREC